jgi:MFS family permease
MVGWSFAMYEIGAILSGAMAGRLSMRMGLRAGMCSAAIVFAIGSTVSAIAPTMVIYLTGRSIAGFGGGALVALAFVATERLFSRDIWPQLFAILSMVWGVAAFSGPLLGAVIEAIASWRWAFGFFGIAGAVLAATTLFVLPAKNDPSTDNQAAPLPVVALLCLTAGIVLISVAGVNIDPWQALPAMLGGLLGLFAFFYLQAKDPQKRLFPAEFFDIKSVAGAGFMAVALLSISTVSFTVYGPLLLASLHGFSPLATGYIIASESLAWSALSIMVANAPPERERLIVTGGAVMIAAGVLLFAIVIPAGSTPLILLGAVLQGGGFGLAWPFITRKIVEATSSAERTIAASGVPALQRIGYAIGGGLAGMIANIMGFSEGYTREASAAAASFLFLGFLPLATIACWLAWRTAR